VTKHWWRSYALMLKWNVLRMREELPFLLVIQIIISSGVVIGFSFLIPDIDTQSAVYLTTGAMTIALITVGMVIAPQIVSYRKREGVLDYQKSMPVSRIATLAADASMWVCVALPGLLVTLLVATARFDLEVSVSPLVVPAILLVSASAAGFGYCLAYSLKPEILGPVTNLVIITALMFAPVNYPAERLPSVAQSIHEWLPFQYMAQAIRETVNVPATGVPLLPFVILAAWAIAGLALATRVMSRRI
jgi:ABC-2 type transport system permease protein